MGNTAEADYLVVKPQPLPARALTKRNGACSYLLAGWLVIIIAVLVVPILRRTDIGRVHHKLQNGSRVNLVQQLEASLYQLPRGDPGATHED